MQYERSLSRPLLAFLVLVGATLATAATSALMRPDLDGALRQLGAHDCERHERLALVERVLELGAASRQRPDRLAAAMAAIVLQDRTACDRLLAAELPLTAADAAALDRVSLAEPVLRTLLQAMLLDGRGDADGARAAYRRVLRQCRSWDLPLAKRLAEAGLQRLG